MKGRLHHPAVPVIPAGDPAPTLSASAGRPASCRRRTGRSRGRGRAGGRCRSRRTPSPRRMARSRSVHFARVREWGDQGSLTRRWRSSGSSKFFSVASRPRRQKARSRGHFPRVPCPACAWCSDRAEGLGEGAAGTSAIGRGCIGVLGPLDRRGDGCAFLSCLTTAVVFGR